MKITAVDTAILRIPTRKPISLDFPIHSLVVAHVRTDEGVTGLGYTLAFGGGGVESIQSYLVTRLGPLLIGQDPLMVERLWERMYRADRGIKRQGVAAYALSALDIALWDIVGKACNKPVHKLIGGAFRTEVDAYATGLYFTDMDRLVDEAVEEASGYVSKGFKAIKMKIGLGSIKRDFDRVKAVRDAIGPDVKLMVDANHCLTVPAAIRLGRKLEELDIEWFEEPISPEDIDGYVEVSRALDMAVAGGENEFTRWGFRDAIVRKAMDIVQPDVCAAGGITECKKIAALASTHGVECVPHAWGSAVGLAATIHFLASIPNQPPSLFPMPPMLEFEQEENPFRDHLAVTPINQVKGVIAVPTGAGLGIEIDRSVIDRYRVT
jgi:L-alanine-DL-glutamate epimerase and related enzymes of enolase superfamily